MNNHIKGKQGCPKCGKEKSSKSRVISFEEWESVANVIHNNFYTYHKETFHGTEEKTLITCPKHGDFWQKASNHTNLNQGCPKCAHIASSAETEICDFIKSFGFTVETRQRLLKGGEIDVYVPSKKFGIEYNGLYWHSELTKKKDFHLNKTLEAERLGIRLFHIFEDEWLYKREIIKSMIRNLLGVSEKKVYARKCELREIPTKTAREFLNANHLQGYCPSSHRVGLYHNDRLVSVMTFGPSRHFIGSHKYEYELLRFCNEINTNVIGGASKLFKWFTENFKPASVVSYADRRWSAGNLYNNLGFNKYGESAPNYFYIINRKRVYRFNLRKSVLVAKYGCPPDMSERQFCYNQQWYRIYDCGCLCYVWKNPRTGSSSC